MKTPELTIYWKKLPHWRMSGAIYFVTWRLAEHQPILAPEERTIVMNGVRHFENQRYALQAHVVMDDHVHVILLPFEGFSLHRIVHSWKSVTAKRLVKESGRTAPVWQREYFDRIVRDEDELMQKAQYITANPWNRWPYLEEYPWVGFGSFL
ncbi:MAG TPA: transposase [Desulfomonilaceae bacterium]|nr:transposase [Desulfomonilaceae bacterium]